MLLPGGVSTGCGGCGEARAEAAALDDVGETLGVVLLSIGIDGGVGGTLL